MIKEYKHFQEKQCAICGKNIVRVNLKMYVYKIRLNKGAYSYFCSYNCYRKAGGDSGVESHYVRSKLKNTKRKSTKTMQKMS